MTGENGNKVLVFSEWERMLFLVRELAGEMGLSFAWHTGSVPQQKRRQEIIRFKTDPECRVFLSTDSGSVGLNLQEASAVVNLDLPWNPAKLEQRIARAWRKHQKRSVRVVNLVCENSIEHRMLSLLSQKQQLADALLDGRGDFTAVKMPSGRAALMERLQALLGPDGGFLVPIVKKEPETIAPPHADPYQVFHEDVLARLADRLLLLESCEGAEGRPTLLVVTQEDPESFRPVAERLLRESFASSVALPTLELLDRTTYETIQRLVETGILKRDKREVRQFHCSPIFTSAPAPKKEFRKEAREVFGKAERKMRMATVLSNGGFPLEALSSVREAVEFALKASAYLAGDEASGAGDEPVPLVSLESRLIAESLVPDFALSTVARVRDSGQGDGLTDEGTAQKLIEECRSLVDHVNQRILASAFG
jgi:hypothetical protein